MVSLPVLSSFAEELTTTVNDEFKKLIQPHSLVIAAIVLSCQFMFVFPPLVAVGVRFAVAANALSAPWQITLALLALFTLGYLINSLSGFFLNLVNGNEFRDTQLLGPLLLMRQQRVFNALQDIVRKVVRTDTRNNYTIARAAARLAHDFPREQDLLAPTRLGNVMLSAASYTLHQYGAHLEAVWPFMELVLNEEDTELRQRLRENQDSLQFLAGLTVILVILAIEVCGIQLLIGRPLQGLAMWSLILLVAYAAYSAAVQKARSWGQSIRVAFDLHLDSVAKKLRLRSLPEQSFAERKERWHAVSRWLIYSGGDFGNLWEQPVPEAGWYVESTKGFRFEVQHPPTITVQSTSRLKYQGTRLSQNQSAFGLIVEYILMITSLYSNQNMPSSHSAFLLVIDSRITDITELATGNIIGLSSSPITRSATSIATIDNTSAMLWLIDELVPGGSCVLQYTIRRQIVVEVEPDSAEISLFAAKEDRFVLRIQNNNGTPTAIRVTAILPTDKYLPEYSQYNIATGDGEYRPLEFVSDLENNKVHWLIENVSPQAATTLRFKYHL